MNISELISTCHKDTDGRKTLVGRMQPIVSFFAGMLYTGSLVISRLSGKTIIAQPVAIPNLNNRYHRIRSRDIPER
jgi:hypothetical protein